MLTFSLILFLLLRFIPSQSSFAMRKRSFNDTFRMQSANICYVNWTHSVVSYYVNKCISQCLIYQINCINWTIFRYFHLHSANAEYFSRCLLYIVRKMDLNSSSNRGHSSNGITFFSCQHLFSHFFPYLGGSLLNHHFCRSIILRCLLRLYWFFFAVDESDSSTHTQT